MIVWRISRFRDLSGAGGLKANGRWHYAGQPVVYLAENPAAALLEVCVHTAASDVPPTFTLLRIEGPDGLAQEVETSRLPQDWTTNSEQTRELGTEWLRARSGVLLRVPSAVIPWTFNFVFNPVHADAGLFRITEATSYPFDLRIKR